MALAARLGLLLVVLPAEERADVPLLLRPLLGHADVTAAIEFVCLVPCVGSRLASQNVTSHRWLVQPCVRPVSAVRMTAGPSALRESGPTQARIL
jgi:hypothetical protein